MKRSIILFIIISIPSLAFSATIQVPGDYPTIQQGIDAAVNGDTVLVAPGTYVENIDFLGKAITVKSSGGAGLTVIDGNNANSVVFLSSGENTDSVLEGFSIVNGQAVYGGGIICNNNSSPIIVNNIIKENNAWHGGGIRCSNNSSPLITNNIIYNNTVSEHGGGLYCHSSSPVLQNNIIASNSANHHGGGILCFQASPTIKNNIIYENKANDRAGGIYFDQSTIIIVNSVIYNNVSTTGGGIWCRSPVDVLTNTVLWDNSATEGSEITIMKFGGSEIFSISYSDVDGGKSSLYAESGIILTWGPGMIDADPLFVDPANGDFHLTYPSPCKDTGDNTAVTELYDFEGDPRIAYGTVDMGADEFYTHLYWTGDATPGGNVEVKIIDLPSTAPVVLWAGSGVLNPPMKTMFGDWYLQLPVVTTLLLGSIPAGGVLHHPRFIPLDYPYWDIPIQAFVGTQLTNLCLMEVK